MNCALPYALPNFVSAAILLFPAVLSKEASSREDAMEAVREALRKATELHGKREGRP